MENGPGQNLTVIEFEEYDEDKELEKELQYYYDHPSDLRYGNPPEWNLANDDAPFPSDEKARQEKLESFSKFCAKLAFQDSLTVFGEEMEIEITISRKSKLASDHATFAQANRTTSPQEPNG